MRRQNLIAAVVTTLCLLIFTGCAGGSWGTGVKPNTFQEQEDKDSAGATIEKLKLKRIFGGESSGQCTPDELSEDPTKCRH